MNNIFYQRLDLELDRLDRDIERFENILRQKEAEDSIMGRGKPGKGARKAKKTLQEMSEKRVVILKKMDEMAQDSQVSIEGNGQPLSTQNLDSLTSHTHDKTKDGESVESWTLAGPEPSDVLSASDDGTFAPASSTADTDTNTMAATMTRSTDQADGASVA